MSIVIKGTWIRLCVRADAVLQAHADNLNESDTAFLKMLSEHKVVWGTARQAKRLDEIEAAINNPPA
jgi:hypothetical protein